MNEHSTSDKDREVVRITRTEVLKKWSDPRAEFFAKLSHVFDSTLGRVQSPDDKQQLESALAVWSKFFDRSILILALDIALKRNVKWLSIGEKKIVNESDPETQNDAPKIEEKESDPETSESETKFKSLSEAMSLKIKRNENEQTNSKEIGIYEVAPSSQSDNCVYALKNTCYCSCETFQRLVLDDNRMFRCVHLIAIRIAENVGTVRRESVKPDTLRIILGNLVEFL